MHEEVWVTAYPEAPSSAVAVPFSAPARSSAVGVLAPGQMLEESGGVDSVTAYHDGMDKSSSTLAPSSAVAVTAPAPGRMLEEYRGVVSVTVYTEVFNGSGNSSAQLPSSVPVLAPAAGRVLEESGGAVSVTAYADVPSGSGNDSSSVSAPTSRMLEESKGDVSVPSYPEVFHDNGNKPSSDPAPSSMVALPSPAPATGWMFEENNGAVSVPAYPEVFHDNGNKSSSDPAPSSASAVPAAVWMLEENNCALSVPAYPEVFHDSGNKWPSFLAPSSTVAMPSLAPTPSSVVALTTPAPAPAPGLLLKSRYINTGVGFVTSYLEVCHGSGRRKSSSPPSTAALAPASGRMLDDYAKEWAARKAAAGAPLHHCVLPFLTGAPKAVECHACYKTIHPLEEVKCSVSRCEQSFHLSCVVEDTANFSAESFRCPQHGCMVCKQKMFFWRCGRCTVAAHTKCAPWPLIHLKDDQGSAICWRHPSNWLLQNENADLTNNIEEAFCRLPIPYVNEEFNIDSTIRDFSAIVCKPPSYTHIRRNVYLVKKKRADSSAETGCRNCRADSFCRDDCECRGLSMSCSKNCRCSDLCCNKPFRKDKKFKVVKSEGCGWGAVAMDPLEKGDFIIEYVGEVINDSTCEQRLWEMKRRGDKNFYMCEISKDCTIDATFKGNTSRFLNHSCDPNCKLEKWQVEGEIRVGVFASRSIEVGEPLTYDYRFVHFGEKVKCHCGAKSCQGYLGIQLKNPTQDTFVAAALENQANCSPSRLIPETHLLPWTNCIEVPFNLRSKTKIDRLCWGRKRQRTSIIDPSPSLAMEDDAPVPKGFSALV